MADPDLSADPQLLAKAGDTLDEPANRLRAALTNFMTAADDIGDAPWGTDQLGQAIGQAYQESKVGDVLWSARNLADGVDDVRSRVRQMAGQYANVEEVNSQ